MRGWILKLFIPVSYTHLDVYKRQIQTEVVALQDKKYQNGLCTVMDLMNEKQLLTQLQEELNSYIDTRIIIGRELGLSLIHI